MRFSEFKINENEIKDQPEAAKKSNQSQSPQEPAPVKPIQQLQVPISTGSRNQPDQNVSNAQQALIQLGFNLPRFGADGWDAAETSKAISDFQKSVGLTTTGNFDPETIAALNKAIGEKNISIKPIDVKQLLAMPAHGGANSGRSGGSSSYKLEPLPLDPQRSSKAHAVAEQVYGGKISPDEWDHLLRVTAAESSNHRQEMAWVVATVLNRARSGKFGGNTIMSVIHAKRQFQPVMQKSPHFTNPNPRKIDNVMQAIIDHLADAPKDIYFFGAADPRAYAGPGMVKNWRQRLMAGGGQQVGATIFARSAP